MLSRAPCGVRSGGLFDGCLIAVVFRITKSEEKTPQKRRRRVRSVRISSREGVVSWDSGRRMSACAVLKFRLNRGVDLWRVCVGLSGVVWLGVLVAMDFCW